MKIGFFEIESEQQEYFKNKLKGHELIFIRDSLDENTFKKFREIEDLDIVCIFIYSKLNKKVISKFKNIEAIITRSTGYDHIDIKECKKRKIKILNIPDYGANTVAEHTFALILALSRRIHKSYENTIRGKFSLEGLRGFELKGKTIGIVGLGKIGRQVAKISKAFDMKIIVYDIKKDEKFLKKINAEFSDFNNLISKSDIISIHCPYNKKTHHLINKKNIFKIKKGAVIINTARGSIIETNALVQALIKKHISGAGLDVIEEESLIKEEAQLLSKNFPRQKLENLLENHILLTFDNVLITPHNAFNSIEAIESIAETTIINIKGIINKTKLNNLIK